MELRSNRGQWFSEVHGPRTPAENGYFEFTYELFHSGPHFGVEVVGTLDEKRDEKHDGNGISHTEQHEQEVKGCLGYFRTCAIHRVARTRTRHDDTY